MKSKGLLFIVVLLVAVIAFFSYLLGEKNSTVSIDSLVNNQMLIKDIAELASLEVRGNASIKSTNIVNDGSFTDGLRKLFAERTIMINVPYVAKYGVVLDQQTVNIQQKEKMVNIVLPAPTLLSYEMRLDKADANTKKGLFDISGNEAYANVEKKLYTQSKEQLEANLQYREMAKEKISAIIKNYYAPMQLEVNVVFKDEIKSKVVDNGQ